jgi:hypothetical protein
MLIQKSGTVFNGKDGIREVFLEGEAWFDVKNRH